MKKTNEKKVFYNIIIIVLISIIIASIIVAGYAYAKYRSTIESEAQAQVAKWSFKVNGSSDETQEFDLAFTINPYKHVAENKVAPRNKRIF